MKCMQISKEQNINVYKTQDNDTWDLIAFKVLGDESYSSHLLKANPDLTKIVFFPAGIMIKIPEIKENEKGVPAWVTR